VLQEPKEHTQESDLAGAKARQVVSNMRQDGGMTVTGTTRAILGTRLENVPEPVLSKLPKRVTMECIIRRSKQKSNLQKNK